MATKKIQIEFDLNTNEVKLAGEATLSLAQQVKILQRELQKTPEGTKEFELLRRKLNDTRDNFDRVNAKSRELFGTLSLLPGPIGEVAGKLNGAISLFKTFSGFSFKDLRGQFTGLLEDFKGILMALGSWGDTTKKASESTNTLTQSNNQLNSTLANTNNQALAAGAALAAANQTQVKSLQEKITTEQNYQALLKEQVKDLRASVSEGNKVRELNKQQRQELAGLNAEINNSRNYQKRYETELKAVNGETQKQTESTKGLTAAQQAQNQAVSAGSKAWTLFRGALTAVGIGILIAAVSKLVTTLYDYVTGTAAAKKATDEFSNSLQEENYWLEYNANQAKRTADVRMAQMKAEGKSAKEIRDFELEEAKKYYLQQQQIRDAAFKREQEAVKGNNVEIMDAAIADYRKKNQTFEEAEANFLKIRARNQEEDKKEIENGNKEKEKKQQEANEKAKKLEADRLAERKAQLDAAIQLEINSENTRKDVLEKLLQERLELEKLTGNRLLLAIQENQKKVTESLTEDYENKRQMQLKSAEAAIQIEQSQAEVNTEKLIELLAKRRDIELKEEGLTAQQKLAIQEKYEADFRQLRQQAREKQLVEDIQKNRNNFDVQIQLYRDFANEVIKSNNYTEGEKLRIIEETNDKIISLEQERFDYQVNKLQQDFGELYAYNEAYYLNMFALMDAEEKRYKQLHDEKKITDAEYLQFLKDQRDARIQIGKEELNARLATLDALGNAFGAAAQLAGEQTKLGKGLAVASATVDTYSAANKVMNDPTPIPFFLRLINAAAIVFRGLANVRRILQVQVPTAQKTEAQFAGGVINVNQRRAQGGMINGPGGETTDSIPALLSDGEYVVNARSTRVFRPLLETINSASNLPAFAVGGLVGGSQPVPFKSQNETIADAITTAFGSTPIRTYVTATEVSTQQQFDRIIKSRSLI